MALIVFQHHHHHRFEVFRSLFVCFKVLLVFIWVLSTTKNSKMITNSYHWLILMLPQALCSESQHAVTSRVYRQQQKPFSGVLFSLCIVCGSEWQLMSKADNIFLKILIFTHFLTASKNLLCDATNGWAFTS